ncbi:Hypothetical protein A7982_03080 [Minicystis rosea]|nr:Hypothetical protein A7982_03080 [Minicystis rosea]
MQLKIEDYARIAFSLDADAPNGFGDGGIYAGPLEDAPGADPWLAAYRNPTDRQVTARARLVDVPAGKVFVRWAAAKTQSSWTDAAAGAWWVTDNMAERIVQETVRRFGKGHNSNIVAREYAQVDRTWSDMGAVVVTQTTRPIRVLFGVGRPVRGIPVHAVNMRDALQVIILTTISSPTKRRRRFIGDQFMNYRWVGSSMDFMRYWLNEGIIKKRRG